MAIKFGNVSVEHLRGFIERIERLEDEKATISEYIRDVFSEAKANGFDVKAMREVLKIRKKSANEIEEMEYILDTYKRALGMTPTE